MLKWRIRCGSIDGSVAIAIELLGGGRGLGLAQGLPQPWLQKKLDISAAARALETRLNLPVGDDEQAGCGRYRESVCEIGSFSDLDAVNPECLVVAPTLQDMREERLCAPRLTRSFVVEEKEPRKFGLDTGCGSGRAHRRAAALGESFQPLKTTRARGLLDPLETAMLPGSR
jgi:hypothetical protein